VLGYYAPTARFGSPDAFRAFVDRLHQAGLGVILDWVPAHFPKDGHGLARLDGTALYEHEDPRQGEHPDWGTLVFNFGRREVRNFLLANALYWIEEFHADGLRIDAVASMLYLDYSRGEGGWVPNIHGGRENLEAIDFLRELNILLFGRYPGLLSVAEESTSWPMVSRPVHLGGLGFNLKWNMGWMNDTLRYFELDPVHRRWHHDLMSFSLMYAWHENFILVLSHDEVVHGKKSLLSRMPGDPWQQRANLRLLLAWMWCHPGRKLLFMGGEWGQTAEWDEGAQLDWAALALPEHAGLQLLVRQLNALLRGEPALSELDFVPEGFEWINVHDAEHSVFSFLRRSRAGGELLVVANATPVPRLGYRVGLPVPGYWREILNTDAACYGGSNLGNAGGSHSEAQGWDGRDHSLVLTLPPLGLLVLKQDDPA
jgi:1,4-alpha-glucan branching enzyme